MSVIISIKYCIFTLGFGVLLGGSPLAYNLNTAYNLNNRQMNTKEIFKDIPNYEGMYQVSNLGNVKSFKQLKERILKPSISKTGYLKAILSKDNKQKTYQVHQLVAMTFLGHIPCGLKLVVNHINFNRLDNNLNNLEIVTNRENTNKKHLNSSSKYTGTHYHKKTNRWQSSIEVNKRIIHLGTFETEEEAYGWYKKALISIENGTDILVKRNTYSSKYKGVHWNKRRKRWVSQIRRNNKVTHLGSFNTELDAYNAYKKQSEIWQQM